MLTSIWLAMAMAFATTKALVFGRCTFRLRYSATCSVLVNAEIAQLHAFLPTPAGGVGTHSSHAKSRCTPSKIHGESTQNQLHLLLLDWEKAFDKVDRDEMFVAMKRMKVDCICSVRQILADLD